jgi:hypothetical protein
MISHFVQVRLVEHEIMLAAQGVDSANRQKALRDKLRADHKRTRDAICEQQQQLEQQQLVQDDKPASTLSEAQAVIDVLQTHQKQTPTDIQSRQSKELETWQQSIAQHQELYQALIKLRINVSCRESEVQFKAQKSSTGESDFDELQVRFFLFSIPFCFHFLNTSDCITVAKRNIEISHVVPVGSTVFASQTTATMAFASAATTSPSRVVDRRLCSEEQERNSIDCSGIIIL